MNSLPGVKPSAVPTLSGDRVLLRQIALSDVGSRYLSWLNDQEVVKYTESRFERHKRDGLLAYVKRVLDDPDSIMWAICETSHEHVGNIKLGPINWTHRFGDIGLLIGDRGKWGRGYASESIALVAEYAFRELKLHKLTASMYAENVPSRRAFEKCGFHVEGVRRSHYLVGSRYTDAVLVGKLNEADAYGQRSDEP